MRLGSKVSIIGSVTHLMRRIRTGDGGAWGKLLARFWPVITARATRKLKNSPCRVADEEDVAQQVLVELHRGFADGRWPHLSNRHDLVALLTQITDCRAINQMKHELARKRGGGLVQGESALRGEADSQRSGQGIEAAVPDSNLTPQEQVLQEDWCRHCLATLPPSLQPFAELLLAGHTVGKIASAMRCTERTVARKIALIRPQWAKQLADCA